MILDYTKPTSLLVNDLINRDNPSLPFMFDIDECILSTPTVYSSATDFRNTKVVVTPVNGQIYQGGITLRYRRLVMSNLLPSGKGIMNQWYQSSTIPIATFLTAFNAAYGFSLAASDFTQTTVTVGPTGSTSLTFTTNNPAFYGTLVISFAGSKIPTSTVVSDTVTGMKHWANIPLTNPYPLMRYTTYGYDFSFYSSYFETFSTTTPTTLVNTDSQLQSLVQYLTTLTKIPFSVDDQTTRAGLAGAYALRFNLPSTTYPFRNSDFNRCLFIYRASSSYNIPDGLFLHYSI